MSILSENRRPRLVRQLSPTECALCCCASLLRSKGSTITINDLRLKYVVGRDGLNISDIARILREAEATPHVYALTAQEAMNLRTPMICYWNDNHYVIADFKGRNRVRIVDPGAGVSRIDKRQFEASFSGYAIGIDDRPGQPPRLGVPSSLAILATFAKSHLLLLSLTLAVALGSALTTLWLPQLLSAVFEGTGQQPGSFPWPVAILVGIAVGYGFLMLVRSVVSLLAATAVGKSISENVFSRMMRLPYGELLHRGTGDLLFTLDSVQRLRLLIASDFIVLVVGVVMVITLLIWLTLTSVLAGLAMSVLIAILVLLAIASGRGVRHLSQEETRRRAELQSLQVSALSALESIKTNAMEDSYIEAWRTSNNAVQRYSVGLQSLQAAFSALSGSMQLIGPILIVLIVTVGAPESAEPALIISVQALAGFLLGQVSQVTDSFAEAAQGWVLLERVSEILVRAEDSTFRGRGEPAHDAAVALENVTFSYTPFAKPVLSGVTLTIPSGAKVALVGHSGSGKSTIGRLMVGLHRPNSGTVKIDDQPISNFSRRKFYGAVAYVPQSVVLDAGTLRDNLTSGTRNVSDERILEAARRVGFENDILALPMGLDTPVAYMGQNFSGGQRQRIALVRAALKRARIIVLDEATSSLDNIAEARVTEYLNGLSATRIVIAHRLSTVIDADLIYVFEKGRVVEQGTHHDLIQKNGAYRELYLRSTLEDPALEQLQAAV